MSKHCRGRAEAYHLHVPLSGVPANVIMRRGWDPFQITSNNQHVWMKWLASSLFNMTHHEPMEFLCIIVIYYPLGEAPWKPLSPRKPSRRNRLSRFHRSYNSLREPTCRESVAMKCIGEEPWMTELGALNCHNGLTSCQSDISQFHMSSPRLHSKCTPSQDPQQPRIPWDW